MIRARKKKRSKPSKRARQWARRFPFKPDNQNEFVEYLAFAYDAGADSVFGVWELTAKTLGSARQKVGR